MFDRPKLTVGCSEEEVEEEEEEEEKKKKKKTNKKNFCADIRGTK